MGVRHPLLTALLVTLFVLDVASDVATGVELILNDHNAWGLAVLGLVGLPVVVAMTAELLRGCIYGGCCGEASTDWIPLILYHLYTVVITIGSDCQPRWVPESHYLRAIQGFIQSGPQLVLQLVIVYKGVVIHSFRDLLKNILEDGFSLSFFEDKPLRWYWGLIQLYSLVLSTVSFLQTSIHFNEWPKRRHTLHRFLLILPFFVCTLAYRALAAALLLTLAGQMALVPLLALTAAQVLTFNSLGLDLPRSLAYGICSLLSPVGYSRCRDPSSQPYGLSLLSAYDGGDGDEDGGGKNRGGDRSPEQVDMLRERSKSYLAMHVILGGGVLGISTAILGLLLNFTNVFQPLSGWIIFSQTQMNDLVFPFLAGSYLAAATLTAIFTCCIGRCFEEEYIYPV